MHSVGNSWVIGRLQPLFSNYKNVKAHSVHTQQITLIEGSCVILHRHINGNPYFYNSFLLKALTVSLNYFNNVLNKTFKYKGKVRAIKLLFHVWRGNECYKWICYCLLFVFVILDHREFVFRVCSTLKPMWIFLRTNEIVGCLIIGFKLNGTKTQLLLCDLNNKFLTQTGNKQNKTI